MHFPDMEVCCDWSKFFPLKSADVSGAGTRDEPIRTSAGEANMYQAPLILENIILSPAFPKYISVTDNLGQKVLRI